MKSFVTTPFIEREVRLCGRLSLEILTNISYLCTPLIQKNKITTEYFDDITCSLLKNGIAYRRRSEKGNIEINLKIDIGNNKSYEWNSIIPRTKNITFPSHTCLDFPLESELKAKKLIPECLALSETINRSREIFKTEVLRTIWLVKYKGSTFEVCFDEGRIICQNKTRIINELEIESVDDSANFLLEFVEIICSHLPQTYIQSRSKALRGIELRENKYIKFVKNEKNKEIVSGLD